MLLKSGAGPNKATEDGMTPVHVAAKFGNIGTLVLLLEDGGDPLKKTKVFKSFCFPFKGNRIILILENCEICLRFSNVVFQNERFIAHYFLL